MPDTDFTVRETQALVLAGLTLGQRDRRTIRAELPWQLRRTEGGRMIRHFRKPDLLLLAEKIATKELHWAANDL